ncbi:hypothetical protein Dpep_1150 [Dethiosulfovibrio peptidovorans DSM 11002]|uniref:Uncharacterized protein n=1 Tax=Dethiosulfovibrio peptidovorans DSM 11002 TaxID=469381 RepID=D2Z6S9_9BACT|nr:hypothetical protein Dpep_1150 [Dethiosulfovibrio peptidovorans DSM 11002]
MKVKAEVAVEVVEIAVATDLYKAGGVNILPLIL